MFAQTVIVCALVSLSSSFAAVEDSEAFHQRNKRREVEQCSDDSGCGDLQDGSCFPHRSGFSFCRCNPGYLYLEASKTCHQDCSKLSEQVTTRFRVYNVSVHAQPLYMIQKKSFGCHDECEYNTDCAFYIAYDYNKLGDQKCSHYGVGALGKVTYEAYNGWDLPLHILGTKDCKSLTKKNA